MRVIVKGTAYTIPESFTFREFSLIKRMTGLRAGDLDEALAHSDTDLILAFTAIAMQRAGVKVDTEELFDLDIATDFATEEDEPDPPVETPATATSPADQNGQAATGAGGEIDQPSQTVGTSGLPSSPAPTESTPGTWGT